MNRYGGKIQGQNQGRETQPLHKSHDNRNLPEGWEWKMLEEVADILDSQRVPVNAKERENRQGNIPYFGATGQVGWIDDFLFDEELVLLGEDGAPFHDSAKQKAYIVRGKSWVNNHAHVLRARNGVPNAYIKHYLDIVDYHSFVTGTTRLKLNQAAMRQIPIPIAPPKQQQQIVSEIEKQFSRLDEAVAGLKRIKANLKRYKASVLKAAVEGKLTEEWRKAHPATETGAELLKRILVERKKKWEEKNPGKKYKEPAAPDSANLPELPKGWVWANFEQTTERVTKGSSPNWQGFEYCDSGIPFVRSQNVGWGNTDLSCLAYLPPAFNEVEKKAILREGDLLLNLVGASIGRAAIAPKAVEGGNVNQAVSVITLFDNGITNQYALFYLLSANTQRRIHKEKVDVARANFSLEDIRVLPVAMPPYDEQMAIISEVESRQSIVEEIESLVATNLKRVERLRQSILRKAFSGTLANSSIVETN